MILHAVIEQDDETLYSYNPLRYNRKNSSPFKTVFVTNVLCGFSKNIQPKVAPRRWCMGRKMGGNEIIW